MTTVELLDRLEGVKRQGRGWVARCPAHEDAHASLSIADAGDNLLVKCHAGCEFAAIMAAIPAPEKPMRIMDALYAYHDADGTHLYDVLRFRPKDFRHRAADGTWSMTGVKRVPYRLPDLVASKRGVVIVEGEKDVDRLASLGIVATTNPGGAGKWRPEFAEYLRGRRVVIVPDNDDPGRAHADDVARSLEDIADVRLLELPVPPKGDLSDWLDGGGTVELLREMLRDADPYPFAAERDVPSGNERNGPFRTGREVAGEAPPEWEYIARPWVAAGMLTTDRLEFADRRPMTSCR